MNRLSLLALLLFLLSAMLFGAKGTYLGSQSAVLDQPTVTHFVHDSATSMVEDPESKWAIEIDCEDTSADDKDEWSGRWAANGRLVNGFAIADIVIRVALWESRPLPPRPREI